jgi:tRNA threonylcarbamoyladenosine biosynthesis protein TsaB
MKALAIDTSNLVMGIAVITNDRIIGEFTTNLKKNHSVRLMPAIQDLLNEVDIAPNELERIIVANGPGSYTGVRIGVTAAKTMAWALGIPIVGVSSLEVLAQNGRYFGGLVSPMFDARRNQVYTGLYGRNETTHSLVKDEQIILVTDWLEQLKSLGQSILFLGNDVAMHEKWIVDELGNQAVFGALSEHNPRPGELAMLGINRDPWEDIHTFVPSYLQLAEAEANWLADKRK